VTDRGPKRNREAGIAQGDEGREVTLWLRLAAQQDAAELAIISCGIGHSAAREVMRQFPHITRKHANRLLRFVQMRWQQEGKLTTREARKNLIRQRGEQVYRVAMEYKRAVVLTVGEDQQEVEYVDEPDLRSAVAALTKLIDLDGLAGEVPDEPDKTPEGARQAALDAFHSGYRGALPAGDAKP
jgi:hypothetical protein